MNIQNILNQILTAVFGREVRQAVHDGVKRANDIADDVATRQQAIENRWDSVLQTTTTNAEVIDARTDMNGVTHATLRQHLMSMERKRLEDLADLTDGISNATVRRAYRLSGTTIMDWNDVFTDIDMRLGEFRSVWTNDAENGPFGGSRFSSGLACLYDSHFGDDGFVLVRGAHRPSDGNFLATRAVQEGVWGPWRYIPTVATFNIPLDDTGKEMDVYQCHNYLKKKYESQQKEIEELTDLVEILMKELEEIGNSYPQKVEKPTE